MAQLFLDNKNVFVWPKPRVDGATIFAFVSQKPQSRWRNYFNTTKMHLFGQNPKSRWRNYFKITNMYLFGQKNQSRWRNYFCIIYLAKNTIIDGATILKQPKWMCLAKSLRLAGATIFAFVWPKTPE